MRQWRAQVKASKGAGLSQFLQSGAADHSLALFLYKNDRVIRQAVETLEVLVGVDRPAIPLTKAPGSLEDIIVGQGLVGVLVALN
ncbi:MAG: hypothetical protein OSB69_18855 [Alphaproteobacteria bacterium]|nr:hypothetical protein [Alphaproteobacteria bacterium]